MPEKSTQGEIVVEGAQLFCSQGVTSSFLQVSHAEDDKYLINNKKIATWNEDSIQHMNFGACTRSSPPPQCTPKIQWTKYYENAEFGKRKILIDSSVGNCTCGGGKVEIKRSGQKLQPSRVMYKKVNQNTYDLYVLNAKVASSKGKIAPAVTQVLIKSPLDLPIPENREVKVEMGGLISKIVLEAQVKSGGDPGLVNWVVYEGDTQKKRRMTWLEHGKEFMVDVNLYPEGKTTFYAYGKTPTGNATKVVMHRLKNQLEGISGNSTVPKHNVNTFSPQYTFKRSLFSFIKPIWRIKQGEHVIFSSVWPLLLNNKDHINVAIDPNSQALSVSFTNSGDYTLELEDSDSKITRSLSVKVKNRSIDSIENLGKSKIRKTEKIHLKCTGIRYTYAGLGNRGFWYARKDNGTVVELGLLESLQYTIPQLQSVLASKVSNEVEKNKILSSPFGMYNFSVFGEKQTHVSKISFGSSADVAHIEVGKNRVESIEGPSVLPLKAKAKFKVRTFLPLIPEERVEWQLLDPALVQTSTPGVDEVFIQALQPTEAEINVYLRGAEVSHAPLPTPWKIKASHLLFNQALWCYANGKRRTETGWDEENYIHLSLEGFPLLPVKFKVFIKFPNVPLENSLSNSYCFLKEIEATLNDKGSCQVSFTADEEIKKKVEDYGSFYGFTDARLFFTVELGKNDSLDLTEVGLYHKDNPEQALPSAQVEGKTLFFVLDPNEDLLLPAPERITAINFSNEAQDDIQVGVTQYGITHRIWVNTVGMPKAKLTVKVYKTLLPVDMKETYHPESQAFQTAQEVKAYPEEEVGTDGLLNLEFTPKKEDADGDPQMFFVKVFKTITLEDSSTRLEPIGSQLDINLSLPFVEEISKDCERLGISLPTLEEGQDPTEEQLKEIMGKFMHFKNPLYVSETGTITDRDIISPVLVERGDSTKTRTCYCDRDFTEEEVKSLVKTIKGKEIIWEGLTESCLIEDKSFKSLTFELNKMFRKYNINKCIQKITFLAQVNAETGFFTLSHEEKSKFKSSQSIYKGRGLIQLTGNLNKSKTAYDEPGVYETYGSYLGDKNKFIKNPDLIATNLHYTVDSAGWEWEVSKKVPNWNDDPNKDTKVTKEIKKWKRKNFSKGLGKSLNGLALVMEETAEEEKYFWLQSKMLNGYTLTHKDKPDPHGWDKRKEALQKLKTWFKYDKKVCNEEKSLIFNHIGGDMPPWMKIAWGEYNNYKGINNKQSPLKERIVEYFKNTDFKTGTNTDNWCAAFVSWCLSKSEQNYSPPSGYGAVRARAFTPDGVYKSDHYWESGKSTKDNSPAYGAIAMITWSGGGDHVAFVIGKTEGGRIAVLGGNQGIRVNGVKVGSGITKSSASTSEIKAFMYPKDYNPSESFYNLSSEDITDKLTSEDTHL
ncbi:DUF4280 domain-containing protein [Apibacter muscae]|uniref:PAAR-like protein n=1 Tax=Apibacter muscae TaxID=2509004 RepID=UPI0011AC5760|nr:PAAR-like protein [Apibacter muscae]TWP22591.1 DUF4280 domain-containing protein [Apibacter muscae]